MLQLAGTGALLPMVGGVAGCGSNDDPAGDEDTGTVAIMLPLYESQAPAPDGAMQQAIQEFTGKQLAITWVPNSNYGDRTNVVLASDEIPEVMAISKTPNFVRSAEAGAFWDLTDKIKDYPELQSDNPDIQHNASVNGKVFGLYKARDPIRAATIVRKDWLDKLDLSMPETVDDLYQIAKAFSTEKPSGSESTGLIIPKWPGGYGTSSPFDVIEVWFGAPNKWGEKDGSLIPGFDTEEFFEANAFVKKMVDEGLINRDFATLDSGKWNDPFFTGKGGIIIDVSSRGLKLMSLFKDDDPETYGDKVDMAGNLVGPDGVLRAYPTTGYNGFLAVSRQSVPTEEEVADVLTFLAKLNTQEGQVLLNNGLEGKNFEVEDDYAVEINADDPEAEVIENDQTAFAQLGMAVSGYKAYLAKPEGEPEADLDARRIAFHEKDLEKAVFDPTLAYVSETYVTRGAQLDQIIGDARLKYLAGEIDVSELRSEIKRWHTSGGDDITKELNELYAQGG